MLAAALAAGGDFKALGAADETGVFTVASSLAKDAEMLLFDLINGLFEINDPLVDGEGTGLIDDSFVPGAAVMIEGTATLSVFAGGAAAGATGGAAAGPATVVLVGLAAVTGAVTGTEVGAAAEVRAAVGAMEAELIELSPSSLDASRLILGWAKRNQ